MRFIKKYKSLDIQSFSELHNSSIGYSNSRLGQVYSLKENHCTYNQTLEKVYKYYKFLDKDAVQTVAKNQDIVTFLLDVLETSTSFNYAFSGVIKTTDLTTDSGFKILVRYTTQGFDRSVFMIKANKNDGKEFDRTLYKLLVNKLFKKPSVTRRSIILDQVML